MGSSTGFFLYYCESARRSSGSARSRAEVCCQSSREGVCRGVRGARHALVLALFVFNTWQEWLYSGNKTLDENSSFCQGLFDVGTWNCDFCLQVQKMNVTPLNQVVKCHVSPIHFFSKIVFTWQNSQPSL